jgi:hypothetical protein
MEPSRVSAGMRGGPGGPDLQSQDSVRFKGNARILRFIGPNLNKL